MSFAFNFDGDDIDADDIEHTEPALDHDGAGQDGSAAAPAAPVESHTLEDLVGERFQLTHSAIQFIACLLYFSYFTCPQHTFSPSKEQT